MCLFFDSHPGYFGKVGMRHFHLLKNRYYMPTINVDKLWNLVPADVKQNATESKAPVIDVQKLGYFKVLGSGKLPSVPMVVKAKVFTKLAEKKIQAAGGACVLTA